jgi:hypothetical protein
MKKLTTIFLSLVSTAIMAQIPNPSFENWTSGVPNGWNVLTFYLTGSVTESSSAHAGSHSVSLNSVLFSTYYLGGFVQTGPSTGDYYFANSGNPTAVNGWYQLTTSGGDFFTGAVTAKSGASAIGAGSAQFTTATAVWKQFSICVSYTTGTADSLSIQLELANSGGYTHSGSFALVDDLSFGSCLTGVDDITKDVSIETAYPNPSSSICNVIYSLPSDAHVTVNLYDMSGRKVKNLLEDTYQTDGRYKLPVDVSSLANGLYFCNIVVNGQTYSQKISVLK